MKTYNNAADFEAAYGSEVFIDHVIGESAGSFYFLGSVIGTADHIIQVIP